MLVLVLVLVVLGREDERIVATYTHYFATIRFYGCHGIGCGRGIG